MEGAVSSPRIHLAAEYSSGLREWEAMACDQWWIAHPERRTWNIADVTCIRCSRSRAYKKAIAEYDERGLATSLATSEANPGAGTTS